MLTRPILLLFFAATVLPAADFESGVKPIFAAKCLSCHNEKLALGKLSLHTPEAVLKGGESGAVVQPGDAAKSLIIDKIVTRQMPPTKVKLTDAEIDVIRSWIDKELKAPQTQAAVSEHDVRGIFQARCVFCHGAEQKMGGLDMRTLASRLKGGKSGPALVPGKPEESLLYQRIAKGQMPPDKLAKELAIELVTDAEAEKIKAWITAGAPGATPPGPTPDAVVKESDKKFWSFQSPQRPALPATKTKYSNPIDGFLVAKLEAKNLRYNQPANRLSLLRRVTLDLTGLPPTSAEIAAYERDTAPGAYERVVDRLLASPQYGERWAQHWLDLAGYADSEGFGQDDGVRRFAWRYRDYVIRSLNADKPYSQFLTEQVAGDELSSDWKNVPKGEIGVADQATIDRLAATGFLRTTPDPTNSNERGLLAERSNVLADEVEVLSSSVMGLTMGCARCHNHKYDPIPQRDYYRLTSILQGAYDPYEWKSPNKREYPLALAEEKAEAEANNKPLEAEMARLKALLDKEPKDSPAREQLQRSMNETRQKLKPKPHVRILADNAEPSVSYLLRRGDPVNFADPVLPDVPLVLQNASLKPYKPVSPYPGTSGRRLAFAQWLTQPNHPLTARVFVNQMWMRHFGRGIVPSVSNFGRSGVAPTHPELLDYLATEFVAQGWSMKAMHRLMLTSQAYQQSSSVDPATLQADPENALLTRMPLQRMDAETLYDSLLLAAGRLDAKSFGPAAEVDIRPDKEVTVKLGKDGYRRGIYVLRRRQTPISLLDAFDQPAMTPNCTERRRSNVATQALHMMNGSMSWDLAKFMAGRVLDEAGSDATKQIESIYLRAYSRRPSASEIQTGKEAIASFAAQWPARLASDHSEAPRAATAAWLALANYTHAILNSAEFSFID